MVPLSDVYYRLNLVILHGIYSAVGKSGSGLKLWQLILAARFPLQAKAYLYAFHREKRERGPEQLQSQPPLSPHAIRLSILNRAQQKPQVMIILTVYVKGAA